MKLTKTLIFVFFTLAIFASVFCFPTAQAQGVQPWNVVAEIHFSNAVFSYELRTEMEKYQSDAHNRGFYLGEKGKRALAEQLISSGLPSDAVFEYVLPGFGKMVNFFSFVNRKKQDATVVFDRAGFHFSEGENGVEVDREKLFFSILKSNGKRLNLQLPLHIEKAKTVSQLRQVTVKKASFTTYFSNSNDNRCHNVALATYALDGTTVKCGETFSFNGIVGPRTEQNGYKTAKVISDGSYVDGVGGGVCQVSTTLYNALLLSEIFPNACQHSLVSSYVMAGFDAMVSDGGADLTFTNETGFDIYIRGKTDIQNKSVTFTVYGVPNTYRVERENVEERTSFSTLEIVDKQRFPELIYTDQTKVVTNGSDGVKAFAFLNFYDGEKLVFRQLVRQCSYKLVNKVVARGYLVR